MHFDLLHLQILVFHILQLLLLVLDVVEINENKFVNYIEEYLEVKSSWLHSHLTQTHKYHHWIHSLWFQMDKRRKHRLQFHLQWMVCHFLQMLKHFLKFNCVNFFIVNLIIFITFHCNFPDQMIVTISNKKAIFPFIIDELLRKIKLSIWSMWILKSWTSLFSNKSAHF